MFTTTERKRKRVRLKSFRCRTAQVAGRKGHAIFKCPPALPSGARSPRSQSTPHFRDRLRPFSFRDRSFTCQLIFPTPRNQSFAYIREGRGPAPRRPIVFHSETLLIGFPSNAEAEPTSFALPFGLCDTLGNQTRKPQGAGRQGGVSSEPESPLASLLNERVRWCSSSSRSLVWRFHGVGLG